MKLAIITGASSGIGREVALQLKQRKEADAFWLIARRRDRLEALAKELDAPCEIIEADLIQKEGLQTVYDKLDAEQPAVSYLFNGAGFGKFGGYDEISLDTAERMIDLNVKALVLLTHKILPFMEKGGKMIQMGSASCFTPLPYFNVYASTKSFVLHYTKALRFEAKKQGVTVTCFCPGWVDTEFLGIATYEKGITHPKEGTYKPLLKTDKVVKGALKAAKRGKVMYTTNWYTKLQHLLFKILPDGLLSRVWMKRLTKED